MQLGKWANMLRGSERVVGGTVSRVVQASAQRRDQRRMRDELFGLYSSQLLPGMKQLCLCNEHVYIVCQTATKALVGQVVSLLRDGDGALRVAVLGLQRAGTNDFIRHVLERRDD